MLKLHVAPPRHEDVFLQYYERLIGWSLFLTGNDYQKAEDLVHDAFVQFILRGPDLYAIQNIEGYLHSMLKNAHLSRVRRASQNPNIHLSLVEYDSAETCLSQVDVQRWVEVKDSLRSICVYACARKETSKAGSVLLLRFFHGYYPGEIARVLRTSRRCVDELLRFARREAKLNLINPDNVKEFKGNLAAPSSHLRRETTAHLLKDLRDVIFRSRNGRCLRQAEIAALYESSRSDSVECSTVAHTVSCAGCLDYINKLLGLPLLSERYPTDMLGPDDRPRTGSGGRGLAAAGSPRRVAERGRRSAEQIYQHCPNELRVAINGFVVGSQTVGQETNQLTLSINQQAERISVIEVFSEQDLCLMSELIEAPPDGPVEQTACVELSGGRTLEMSLGFGNPWPTLRVTYTDPELALERKGGLQLVEGSNGCVAGNRGPTTYTQPSVSEIRRWRDFLATLQRLVNPRSWVRPATMTAIVATILVGTLVFMRSRRPAFSAQQLLEQAKAAEASPLGDRVIHRILHLEERRPEEGTAVVTRKIEIWESGGRGTKVRRIYDDKNRVIAGEWTNKNGGREVYRSRRLGLAASNRGLGSSREPEVWQVEPSARDFTALVVNSGRSALEENGGDYVITYSAAVPGNRGVGLIKASLTVRRADLHATALTWVVHTRSDLQAGRGETDSRSRGLSDPASAVAWGGLTVEYRLTEAEYEDYDPEAVAPAVFEPEPELLEAAAGPVGREPASLGRVPLSGLDRATPATDDLEVEAFYLLNTVQADLGEQVTISREVNDRLLVEAVVDSDIRKNEILRALEPLKGRRSVRFDIKSAAEALAKMESARGRGAPEPLSTAISHSVEISNERIAAYDDLLRYFTRQSSNDSATASTRGRDIEEQITQFADRMLERSRRALLHAGALKRLIERFASDETRTSLTAESRSRYAIMINQHASSYQGEVRMLREGLDSVFFRGAFSNATGQARDESGSDKAGGLAAAKRLLELSYEHDEVIRSSFALSSDQARNSAIRIRSGQFQSSLRRTERLASSIQSHPVTK